MSTELLVCICVSLALVVGTLIYLAKEEKEEPLEPGPVLRKPPKIKEKVESALTNAEEVLNEADQLEEASNDLSPTNPGSSDSLVLPDAGSISRQRLDKLREES